MKLGEIMNIRCSYHLSDHIAAVVQYISEK